MDREKIFDALRNCITEPKCRDCPWEECERFDCKKANVPVNLLLDVLNLLKEQEPKTGHWIFESQYCEAWSHTCSECGKRTTTAVNTFANWCWNCGAKMTNRR